MEKSFANQYEIFLPNDYKKIILEVEYYAKKLGIKRIAVVGGVVRDSLLRGEHQSIDYSSKDIDLVIEGSAIKLAKDLETQLGKKRVTELHLHPSYNTAEMRIDGVAVDLATAREETYPKLGENPHVTSVCLEEDLARRDFTINAMALDLSITSLLDPYGGMNDIKTRKLKFLHPESVAEDPTRIIRAARYSARLSFDLESNSLDQVKSTLEKWPWPWENGNASNLAPSALAARLRFELELLIKQETWEKALTSLQEWGGLVLLDKKIQRDLEWNRRLKWADRLGVNRLTALIAGAEDPIALATRLGVAKQQQHIIAENIELQEYILNLDLSSEYFSRPPSKWCKEIEKLNLSPNAIALSICFRVKIWRPLLRWWGRWRLVESPISAKQLLHEGWKPGPEIGKELNRLRAKKLDTK